MKLMPKSKTIISGYCGRAGNVISLPHLKSIQRCFASFNMTFLEYANSLI